MLGVYSTLMDALNRLQKLDSKISSELRSPKQAQDPNTTKKFKPDATSPRIASNNQLLTRHFMHSERDTTLDSTFSNCVRFTDSLKNLGKTENLRRTCRCSQSLVNANGHMWTLLGCVQLTSKKNRPCAMQCQWLLKTRLIHIKLHENLTSFTFQTNIKGPQCMYRSCPIVRSLHELSRV